MLPKGPLKSLLLKVAQSLCWGLQDRWCVCNLPPYCSWFQPWEWQKNTNGGVTALFCGSYDFISIKAHFNFCSLISPMLASRESENKVISTTARNNKAADLYPTRTLAPWRNLHGGTNHYLLLWECAVHLNAVSGGCQHWHQDWCLPCWHPTVHSNWCFQILTLGKQYVVWCRMLFLLSGLFIHTLKTSLFKLFAWVLMNVHKALTKRFAWRASYSYKSILFELIRDHPAISTFFLTQGTAFLKWSPWSLFASAISRTCVPAAGVNCSHNLHLFYI